MNRPKPICLAILAHGLLPRAGGAARSSGTAPPVAQELNAVFFAPAGYEHSAKQILDMAGIQGGLIVHLGCNDGKLTAALRANDRYLVPGRSVRLPPLFPPPSHSCPCFFQSALLITPIR